MVTFSPHIAVDVDDRQAAVALYTDVLEMTVIEESSEETVLQCGDLRLYVMEADEPAVYLEFEVEDLDRKLDEFENAGCSLDAVETPEGETSYIVSDPFGTTYHVFERTDDV